MSKKPDDAAKVAGLASILQVGNRQKEVHPSPAPTPVAAEPPPPSPAPVVAPTPRKKPERVGKYRDPDYTQVGLYIRKNTAKRTRRKLEDTESDMDLSDLVQVLLEQWLTNK